MSFHVIGRRPAHHVESQHLMRPFGWLAPGPKGNHQACNHRTIRLNLDAVLVVAEEMAAPQEVLELPEEDLNRPSVRIQKCDDLGRDIQQVRGDSQEAVAVDTRRSARILPLRNPTLGDTAFRWRSLNCL